jgi:hypothetical protein
VNSGNMAIFCFSLFFTDGKKALVTDPFPVFVHIFLEFLHFRTIMIFYSFLELVYCGEFYGLFHVKLSPACLPNISNANFIAFD